MKTRILLTGSNGYVGRHLEMAFENTSSDYEIEGLDPMVGSGGEPGMSWRKFVQEDLNELAYPKNLYANYDWVIHCGALPDSQADFPSLMGWNYEVTREMVKHISYLPEKRRPKFLFISSIAVQQPMSWYAWTKKCAEDVVKLMLPDAIIARPCQVFGGDENPDRKSLVKRMLDGDQVTLYEGYARDFVYVKDLCYAIIRIVERAVKPYLRLDDDEIYFGRTYELGVGAVVLATQLAKMAGREGLEEITIDQAVARGDLKFLIPKTLCAMKTLPGYSNMLNVIDYVDKIRNHGYRD